MFIEKKIEEMTKEEIQKEVEEWLNSTRFKGRKRITLLQRRLKELE